MKRDLVVAALFSLMAIGLTLDLYFSSGPNPYTAPPILALGSGVSASGGHCSGGSILE